MPYPVVSARPSMAGDAGHEKQLIAGEPAGASALVRSPAAASASASSNGAAAAGAPAPAGATTGEGVRCDFGFDHSPNREEGSGLKRKVSPRSAGSLAFCVERSCSNPLTGVDILASFGEVVRRPKRDKALSNGNDARAAETPLARPSALKPAAKGKGRGRDSLNGTRIVSDISRETENATALKSPKSAKKPAKGRKGDEDAKKITKTSTSVKKLVKGKEIDDDAKKASKSRASAKKPANGKKVGKDPKKATKSPTPAKKPANAKNVGDEEKKTAPVPESGQMLRRRRRRFAGGDMKTSTETATEATEAPPKRLKVRAGSKSKEKPPTEKNWVCHGCDNQNDIARKRCISCQAWKKGVRGTSRQKKQPVSKQSSTPKKGSTSSEKEVPVARSSGAPVAKIIPIKELHEVGDKVYACWIENNSYYRAVIKGINVIGTSKYGDIRTYHVVYDDGDEEKSLSEILVFSEEDYNLSIEGNLKGVNHRTDGGAKVDAYATVRGWFETDSTGNMPFSTMGAAARARDDALVNRQGARTTESQLNFPDEWSFELKGAPVRLTHKPGITRRSRGVSGAEKNRQRAGKNQASRKRKAGDNSEGSRKRTARESAETSPEQTARGGAQTSPKQGARDSAQGGRKGNTSDVRALAKEVNKLHREHRKEIDNFAREQMHWLRKVEEEQKEWLKKVKEEGRKMREEHVAKCRKFVASVERIEKKMRSHS